MTLSTVNASQQAAVKSGAGRGHGHGLPDTGNANAAALVVAGLTMLGIGAALGSVNFFKQN